MIFEKAWYLCKVSAIDNVARSGYSEGDGAGTDAGIIGDADGPERAEGKVDIITSDKTNKTLILVCY